MSEYFQASHILALRSYTPPFHQYQATFHHSERPVCSGNQSDFNQDVPVSILKLKAWHPELLLVPPHACWNESKIVTLPPAS
jgi:hypothetical protein